MTPDEKRLYHQIHPVKLFTDVSTAFGAVYLLWVHAWISAFLLAFVPSILISFVIIRYVNLEKYRDSPFGRYIKKYMDSRWVDTLRFGGFFVMAGGGWFHHPWLIGLGILIIVMCWCRGLLFHS